MRTRRSVAALAAAIAFATTGTAHAFAERPPAGQVLDVSREIALPPGVARPCLAVRTAEASILLDRSALERAAAATPARWTNEREREALIRGNRSKALLALAGGPADATGCVPVEAARLAGAAHLVVELLEAGDASVVAHGAAKPDRGVTVRYLGMRSGPAVGRGEIRFLRGDPRRTFFIVEWWAS